MPHKKRVLYSPNPIVSMAQRDSAEGRYLEMLARVEEGIGELEGRDLGELYLVRGQAKIFMGDESMLEDLRMARKHLPYVSDTTTIGSVILPDSPRLFTYFNPDAGWVSRMKMALHRSAPYLQKLCGGFSPDLAYEYEAELCYQTGHFQKSRELAEPVYQRCVENNHHYLAILAGFTLVRCYVAQGDSDKLDGVMTQMVRYTRILSQPRYRNLYEQIRMWLMSVTGSMGGMPRYLISPDGTEHPIIEDRIRTVSEGALDIAEFEERMLEAARVGAPGVYSMKGLHHSIYKAMLHYKLGLYNTALTIFYEMYELTQKNRLIMPFVEYGTQILPLLQYALSRKNGARFARRWSDKLIRMATQYEESLRIIRGEGAIDSMLEEELTGLELEILEKMVMDMSISEIAESYDQCPSRIKEHIREIYRKLNVHNRSEAVAKTVGGKLIKIEH